jgi:hypothetical protein
MKSEIYISCVDSVKSRFDIAEILNELKIDKVITEINANIGWILGTVNLQDRFCFLPSEISNNPILKI